MYTGRGLHLEALIPGDGRIVTVRKLAPLLTVLAILLIPPGCATISQAELPEISIVNLRVADMTLFETTAQFTVRITNANPDPLILEGGSVKVYLAGVKVGKGLISDRIELKALSTDTVELPIYISHLALATRLRTILQSKQLPYRIEGVLWGEPSFGMRRKIRTSHEGVFDFEPSKEPKEEGGTDASNTQPESRSPSYWRDRAVEPAGAGMTSLR
jgi:LEA14-like dessication related protein